MSLDRGAKAPVHSVATEAECYGSLHPGGRRLPASAFGRDPDRVNGLSELCKECAALRGGAEDRTGSDSRKEQPMTNLRHCPKCGKDKPADGFKKPFASRCEECRKEYFRDSWRKRHPKANAPALRGTAAPPVAVMHFDRQHRPIARVPVEVATPGATTEEILAFLVNAGRATASELYSIGTIISGLKLILGPNNPTVLALLTMPRAPEGTPHGSAPSRRANISREPRGSAPGAA